ncbi:hypothetical protein [Thiothrix sp.]|jgi:hypothetical protein|uniref:hypothetical protein n=1 Tax=Thiothrix sp. TaxID=1032 RepID=UPI00257DE076|nr:hypothetical protein [Thiothrix sp.]
MFEVEFFLNFDDQEIDDVFGSLTIKLDHVPSSGITYVLNNDDNELIYIIPGEVRYLVSHRLFHCYCNYSHSDLDSSLSLTSEDDAREILLRFGFSSS